jgi:hypothetical protein
MTGWIDARIDSKLDNAMAKWEKRVMNQVQQTLAATAPTSSPALPAPVRCLVPPLAQASA